MEVKFSWEMTGDPKHICGITMDLENVPREGELVYLEVQINQDEWVNKSGRVKDVIWAITGKQQKVTVILGA